MNMFQSRRGKIYLGGMLQGTLVRRLAIGWVAYNILLFHGLFLVNYLEGSQPTADDVQPTLLERYEAFAWLGPSCGSSRRCCGWPKAKPSAKSASARATG